MHIFSKFEIKIYDLLSYIIWDIDPLAFEIGPITFQWYGILFMSGIVLANQLLKWMYKREGIPNRNLEYLFYLVFAGVVIGARLGHVFFYDWPYFSQNLLEIPMIWKGGLASHGGTLGVLIAVWLYVKFVHKTSILWVGDKILIAACVASAFIRLGNLMNHEIIGLPTDKPWAFVFTLVDELPRHPAQLYEAFGFIAILGVLLFCYLKTDAAKKSGFIAGLGFSLVFTTRFLIEFVKNSQGGFESNLGNVLSTGQWLSVPFVLFGLALIGISMRNANQKVTKP